MKVEDMDVWKQACELSVSIYREMANLKDFGFRDQITRSGLSIPSNIAEGFGRSTDKEKRNFLNYAKGSCSELRTQTYIGMKIGYIDTDTAKSWIKQSNDISSMLTALMNYLDKQSQRTLSKTND